MKINEMRNLGPVSERMLGKAGIETVDQLRARGAVGAYLDVKQAGNHPGLNFLWSLEGALSDREWREVAKDDRLELLTALESMEEQ